MKLPEPIDAKRRDEIIEAIAKKVQQYGMLVPAIFFLEMNKPLSYIGGQAMHFFSPIASVVFQTFEDYAYFFDDRQNVELLIQRLEALSLEEEEANRRAKKEQKARKGSLLDEAVQMEEGPKNSDRDGRDLRPQ
ncbi:MAG: hypothetical protein ACOX3V_08240 [Bacillota bacterium]